MKTYLDEVIELYEEEKRSLEKTIAEYLGEGDYDDDRQYKYAHYHHKALLQVNSMLKVFYEMKIPYYSDILDHKRIKEYYDKLIKQEDKYNMLPYFKERIEEEELKIQRLKQQEIAPRYDSQEIDDALFGLANQQCEGFRFYFKKDPDLYLNFRLSENKESIEIAFPAGVHLSRDFEFYFRKIDVFNKLGFYFSGNDVLICQYSLYSFKDAIEIKTMLARLVYDIFQFNRKYDAAKLVYL